MSRVTHYAHCPGRRSRVEFALAMRQLGAFLESVHAGDFETARRWPHSIWQSLDVAERDALIAREPERARDIWRAWYARRCKWMTAEEIERAVAEEVQQ